MLEDNTAALKWCYNPVNHSKQKHIPVAYHFVREQVALFDNVNVVAVKTDYQLADLFTKCLAVPRMRFLVDSIRGLNPSLPATTKVERLQAALTKGSDRLQAVFNLKEWLQNDDDKEVSTDKHLVEPDTLFEMHFREQDP